MVSVAFQKGDWLPQRTAAESRAGELYSKGVLRGFL